MAYSISLEFKVFYIATVFALLKFFAIDAKNPYHLLFARSFFVISHLFFFMALVRVSFLAGGNGRLNDEKMSSRKSLRDQGKSLAIRCIIVALVHYKSGILPPLFVSVVMGSFSLLEDKVFAAQLTSK